MLGWKINTRLFRIYLPTQKAREWTHSIKEMLKSRKVNTKLLESTIGRLNHEGYIIPQSRYFLNRLRHLIKRCKQYGPQPIPNATRADLEFWIDILNYTAQKGIDINNITFTKATEICISDACEHGIGGYNMSGLAWRWELPNHMQGKFSINLLEFLAAAVTIEMTLRASNKPQKILFLTDSTSALGWMYKASFSESKPIHDKVARWLALKLMEKESALYSQHFKGKHNTIADSLSLDQHLSNDQLTYIFKILLPLLVLCSR